MAAPDTAAPSTSYSPVVTDLMRLVRVLFSPGAVFGEIKDKPTFWMPWFLVSIMFAVVQFLQAPFQTRVREIMMQQSGRELPAGATGPVAQILGAVFTPVVVLIIVAIAAAILYGLTAAFGGEATYKKMLTVTIFMWPLEVIRQLLTYAVLSMRGVESINSAADMWVSLGADLLLPTDAGVGTFVRAVLAGIGPIQIWGAAIVAVGIATLTGLEKGKAWTVAIISWLIGVVVGGGLAAVGMRFAGG